MNKYQKALDKIKIMGDKDLYNEFHLEWAETLQELVDKHEKLEQENFELRQQLNTKEECCVMLKNKETSKKPKKKLMDGLLMHYCSNCNTELLGTVGGNVVFKKPTNYCPNCGQKLEWNEEYDLVEEVFKEDE